MATGRQVLSNLIKGTVPFEGVDNGDFYYQRVLVKTASGTLAVAPIGTPLVWNETTNGYEVFVAQTIPTTITGTNKLPDAAPVCITVGTRDGVGSNLADATATTTGVEMEVVFRGPINVSDKGIVWGSVNATNQALFWTQLEKQRINRVPDATVVTPYFVN